MKTNQVVVAIACAALTGMAGAVGQNISVTDLAGVAVTDAETQVDVASGGTAEFANIPYDVTVRAQAGANVRLGVYTDDAVTNAPWASKVALWLDGSLVRSFNYYNAKLYKPSGVEGISVGANARIIDRWYDRRDTDHTMEWRAYNNRGVDTTLPYVIDSSDYRPNGLSYVSLGVASTYCRRLPFIKVVDGVELAGKAGDEPTNAVPAKYVLMVFGSQNNGGRAIIAGMGRYANAADQTNPAVTEPIFNSSRETRLDGVDVDPTKNNLLNGGWQIIGFKPWSADKVLGVG